MLQQNNWKVGKVGSFIPRGQKMVSLQFFNFGDLKIMLKWKNDNLQNNIQGPTMQGPRYINPLSSILDIYTGRHGQSNCEMNNV
jgi:hypothetical protein